ncbi:MAG: M48 family metallopeptidase [Patescibacteria group bacterium]|nr:M48 family metallopeptidase [Patescibacteria group bacterium]
MYKQISANKRKSIVLIILFIILVGAIGWALGQIFRFGYAGIIWALIIAIGLSFLSYYSGDKIALFTAGAQPIAKEQNPYVYRMVENLCITSGLPLPKIYIINDPAPNAFATGRDPKHSSIAVTTGLIERLENEELEGVLAHELSHVKNYDIRIMMVVIICVGFITLLADIFLRGSLFGGSRRREGGSILAIVGLILIILSPIFARLIQFAISRKREFLADASGALLTRYPEGLARALEKISSYKDPMRRTNKATAHLYIASPFGGKKGFRNLFSTHPPIEERVKALRTMA